MMETIPCDLCGGSESAYLFSERGYRLLRCLKCEMLYVNPRPSAQEQSRWVIDGRTAGQRPITRADHDLDNTRVLKRYYRRVLDAIEPSRHRDAVLLDVGCGTGGLMAAGVERGWQVAGIEPNASRAALAGAYGPIYRSPDELPGQVGAITLVNVFSHLRSPMAFFRQAEAVLSPGGRLYLKTGELGRIRKNQLRDWEIPDHLFFAGLGCIERYMEKVGLTVVEKRRIDPVEEQFSKESFQVRGRSITAYLAKRLVGMMPGVRRVLIGGMHLWNLGTDAYTAEVVAEKRTQRGCT